MALKKTLIDMIIAAKKKKENIVEYLIYMYQVEDMIRSYDMDIDKIRENIISQFDVEDDIKEEMIEWYNDLISKMHKEGITKSGHLKFIKEITEELFELHKNLLNSIDELEYIKLYNETKPSLEDFKTKTNDSFNDIEIFLVGLYGLFIMRLKKSKVSEETENAIKSFSEIMNLLAKKYKQNK